MTTEIKLDRKHHDKLYEIEAWCRERFGLGSRRFVKDTWLGIEDWFYYEERVTEMELTEEQAAKGEILHVDASDDEESDLIFVFRRETDASVFSLKWQ